MVNQRQRESTATSAPSAWFDMHVLCGVIGPLFIFLHTAAKLDNRVSLAFWSLVGTVASGLLGRYLTTQLPEWASVAALATHDVSRSLADLRARHISVRAAADWRAAHQRRVAEIALRSSPRILAFLAADDLDRLLGRGALASRLRPIADRHDRRTGHRLAARILDKVFGWEERPREGGSVEGSEADGDCSPARTVTAPDTRIIEFIRSHRLPDTRIIEFLGGLAKRVSPGWLNLNPKLNLRLKPNLQPKLDSPPSRGTKEHENPQQADRKVMDHSSSTRSLTPTQAPPPNADASVYGPSQRSPTRPRAPTRRDVAA